MKKNRRIPLNRIASLICKAEKNPKNIFCLGCAVKVPLKEILYPALEKLSKKLSLKDCVSLKVGDEACVFETNKAIELKRDLYPAVSLRTQAGKIRRLIEKFKPNNALILASYMDFVTQEEITETLFAFCNMASVNKRPLLIGKGHTIKISKVPEQKFIMVDYLKSSPGKYYGVASTDTIVTLDFNLKHSHWLNIFISFNNALNDLFALGVYKDIKIYPIYDSLFKKDNQLILDSFPKYLRRYNFNYDIIDLGPLNLNLEAIGATVVGVSDKELPRSSGLFPGQLLIVTRPIGDLSALVLHILKDGMGKLTKEVRNLKLNVLSHMLIPNIEIARIISRYLPPKGQRFDPEAHITATKDLSGAGISSFEEISKQSRVDIYLHSLKFHSNKTLTLRVPNNTSNTNGPIVIAAHKKIAGEIIKRLESIGCNPWIAGKVGEKRKQPNIYLADRLKKYEFIRRKIKQLFSRYQFIPLKKIF